MALLIRCKKSCPVALFSFEDNIRAAIELYWTWDSPSNAPMVWDQEGGEAEAGRNCAATQKRGFWDSDACVPTRPANRCMLRPCGMLSPTHTPKDLCNCVISTFTVSLENERKREKKKEQRFARNPRYTMEYTTTTASKNIKDSAPQKPCYPAF